MGHGRQTFASGRLSDHRRHDRLWLSSTNAKNTWGDLGHSKTDRGRDMGGDDTGAKQRNRTNFNGEGAKTKMHRRGTSLRSELSCIPDQGFSSERERIMSGYRSRRKH